MCIHVFFVAKITKVPLSHRERTDNSGDKQQCFVKWSYAAALRSPASSSSFSSLSSQCRRSVSQGLGSFQSPGAHPSEPPAKLLLSLCSALFLCSPLGSHFFTSSHSSLSPSLNLLSTYVIPPHFPPSATALFTFSSLSVFPSLYPSSPLPLSVIQLLCSRA